MHTINPEFQAAYNAVLAQSAADLDPVSIARIVADRLNMDQREAFRQCQRIRLNRLLTDLAARAA